MKSITFILISAMSGIFAGLILAGINMVVVEPIIDRAIEIENSKAISSGENIDVEEFNLMRTWQKSGSFIAGALIGMAFGSVVGIVYLFIRRTILFSNDRKNALLFSLIMCTVLFVIPFLKYSGNPPAVGNPETIYYREALYVGFLAVSSITALGLDILYCKLRKIYSRLNIVTPVVYLVIMGFAFMLFPSNPDKISISMDLVNSFRVVTAGTMIMFWITLGLIFGTMWHKFKPHETTRITTT